MSGKRLLLLAAVTFLGSLPLFAVGPSFHPDNAFTGSSLTGWHTVGPAEWRAENGEVIGTSKQAGGWLVLDRSYQDIGVYAQFRCTGGCETGVLLRAEKTSTGMRGIYVALSDPDLASYAVTLDGQGQIVARSRLRHGGGLERIAPPPAPIPEHEFHPPVSTVRLPFEPPDSKLRPNDWNEVEILFDANIVRTFLNDGREHGAVGEEGYGPLWRIETRLLDDASVSDQERVKGAKLFAETTTTGGTAIDAQGNIYASDTNKLAVLKITPEGQVSTLVQDPRLVWVDAMWIDSQGYLWLPATQMNLLAPFNDGVSKTTDPMVVYKVKIGIGPPANDHP